MGSTLVLVVVALALAVAGVRCQSATEPPTAYSYAISDLPRQPDVVCAAAEVEEALIDCDDRQNATKCCSGLDAVYANRSSPAFGCLCLPAVLYHTAVEAYKYEVDVLGTLRRCKEHQPGFSTQWAAGEATACPHIPLRGNVIDRLKRTGATPLLADDVPAWAWSNMLQAQHMVVMYPKHCEEFTNHTLGRLLPQYMMLALLCVTLLFYFMHNRVLMPRSAAYRALPMAQQLVTCQHAVYAAAYGLTIIPQTWLAAELLFKAWTGDDLMKQTCTILIAFAMGRAALFTVEACVRSVNWSWLLFLHHALNMVTTTVNIWDGSPVLAVIGAMLDLFTVHEMPLYVVLLGYRLEWPPSLTRGLLRGACGWFAATRVLQTAMLAYAFNSFIAEPVISRSPAFIFTAFICAAFTFLQTYTLFIYWGMDKKLGQRGSNSSSSMGSSRKYPKMQAKKAEDSATAGQPLSPADSQMAKDQSPVRSSK